MIHLVKITKDGFLATKNDEEEILLQGEDVFTGLRSECEIEEGVTLGDILNLVDKNEHLKKFLSNYCLLHIDAHHDSALEEPEEHERLSYLEIDWCAEVWLDDRYNDLELYPNFSGYKNEDDTRYGLDFTPLNQLVYLPVKLNNDSSIHLMGSKERGEGWKLESKTARIKCERSFSLLDVLDGIYWEIGFHGSPKSKEQKKEDLNEVVEEMKEQVEKGIAQPINPDSKGNKIVLSDQVRDFLGMPSNLDERIKESAEDDDEND
jgi:hypothetical protein